MAPLELTREALRVIYGIRFPDEKDCGNEGVVITGIRFIRVDVNVRFHDKLMFGASKAVRRAEVKGLVDSFRNPWWHKKFKAVFHPHRGSYDLGTFQLDTGDGWLYEFRFNKDWVPNNVEWSSPWSYTARIAES
ncbi:MAG: hypothetical protein A3J67_01005 [Parcubacteria group bacterium RIFCSPHIGHO2_02_FULL_48_10b]|nr:MAG: hypothetical protein A3J67_01005 [Parcubacteria group bacterium RIFCSPHIGHO2_02_FULL_48_10b]